MAEKFWHFSAFTSTVKESITSIPGGFNKGGMSIDVNGDTDWGDRSGNQYMKQSGFTTTIKNSLSDANFNDIRGVTSDGTDYYNGDEDVDDYWKYSGFSTTVKDSIQPTGNLTGDIEWDDFDARTGGGAPTGITSLRQLVGHGQGTR